MEVIDGFKAYAPELAHENDGFSGEAFQFLFEVEKDSFWFQSRNKVIKSLAKKYMISSGNFLEIGCGTGFVLNGLQEIFPNIHFIGSEIHINGLHYAKARNPNAEFVQLDARAMPFEDELDGIGAFDVIEHITEDTLVLDNCFKALKPGGSLLISVPQYQFMWSYLDDIAMHKRRYSKKELLRKVKDAGFEIQYCGSFVFTLFPVMLIARLLKTKPPKWNAKGETSELRPTSLINFIFRKFMHIDEWLIGLGLALPWGGSLVLVARK
jgi:SAM-dependent methyltransferase